MKLDSIEKIESTNKIKLITDKQALDLGLNGDWNRIPIAKVNGLFYYRDSYDKYYVAIKSVNKLADLQIFKEKNVCFNWLIGNITLEEAKEIESKIFEDKLQSKLKIRLVADIKKEDLRNALTDRISYQALCEQAKKHNIDYESLNLYSKYNRDIDTAELELNALSIDFKEARSLIISYYGKFNYEEGDINVYCFENWLRNIIVDKAD